MIDLIAMGILSLVILALLVDRYIYTKKSSDQMLLLLNAVIAKNTTEFRDLEAIRTAEPEKEPELPDLTPVEELTDDEFGEMING